MTEYGKYTTIKPTLLLPQDSVKEAKEARKQLLDQVEQRRRENYKRFIAKLKTTGHFMA